jgi:sulfhydrogenase subunit gamma (sulfur reductase)
VSNPYIPVPATIKDIKLENEARDIKTFKLTFSNKEDREKFSFLPGQFAELSLLGYGECPIGIASSPTEKDYLLFTVKRAGCVTTQLHRAQIGDTIGIRGPLGNAYPIEDMEGRNVLIIGGGFAFTTLRATIKYILESNNRKRFKDLTVIYGARTPGELVYKDELWAWEKRQDIKTHITVDQGDKGWIPLTHSSPAKGGGRYVGYVPTVLKNIAPSSKEAIALVCGPPIMIRFALPVLDELGFNPESIFLSLEMRMKCGIGKCGRCNIGHKYVCKDGPVFSFAELQELPNEY